MSDVLADLAARVAALERNAVLLREGEMDGTDVDLAASGVTAAAPILAGLAADGERVSVLRAGKATLVLGAHTPRFITGLQSVTGDNTPARNLTVSHTLGRTPSVVLAIANNGALNCATGTYTDDEFALVVRDIDGANWTSTHNVRWVAFA